PLQERSSTIVITSKHRGPLFQLARQVLASELQPASVVLIRQLCSSSTSPLSDDALLLRFIDSEAAVQNQVDWVIRAIDQTCETTVLGESEADAVWAEVADFDQRAIRVRLSVPLSDVP